ncbi:DUF429 domain-containing protein [Ornithinimicrobium sp. Y1694]|uniref:DUF429 domain-containing protein n=1 Tax=Ornithinimicrobium sp. Y1694 TaxID=3418590 RepID=UPI003CF59D77
MTDTSVWQRFLGLFRRDKSAGGDKGGAAVKGGGGKGSQDRAGRSQPTGKPGRRADADRQQPVLGLAATKDGWVGAVLDAAGHGTPAIVQARTVTEAVEAAGAVTVVALDVPLGLPDESRRSADKEARKFLGAQAAVVTGTPVREAVYAGSFSEANAINRERVGAGLSQQVYDLLRRIMEVDAYVRQDLPFVLVETLPEAAYTELAGAPLSSRRRTAPGNTERRELLAGAGIFAPTTAPTGVATEDMLDACAAAWSAHRVKLGEARTLPERPERFSDGLDAAIHL